MSFPDITEVENLFLTKTKLWADLVKAAIKTNLS